MALLKFSVQFSSVPQSCPTLCNPMNCSTPGFPVLHQLPDFAQTHVHRVGDATQPSHPLSSPSPPAFNLSQHQGLFQWVSPWHQVAKVLEFQLQHQSFQWIFRTDFLYDGLVGSPCSPAKSVPKIVLVISFPFWHTDTNSSQYFFLTTLVIRWVGDRTYIVSYA